MPIPRFSAEASAADVTEALADQGCAIIERLVPASVVQGALAELDPWLASTRPGSDEFAGYQTRRTGSLIARSAACRDLVQNPTVLDVVGRVLSHGTSFHVHLTQVIAIGPGEAGQQIHRDQWAFDFFPFPSGYEAQCNTIWAMNDFTEENGATRIVPGSNKAEDRLVFTADQTEAAVMPAGSVVLYTGSVYHAGGANSSDHTRYGLNLTYALSWLRQEENQYLAVPHDFARTLPDPLLKLMGYQRGAYALGYVDDFKDPLDVLKGLATDPTALAAEAREYLDSAITKLKSQH